MSRILIEGGHRLSGEVAVQGAKNSVLPILAATVLVRGVSVLRGCPHLRDVDASVRILQALGCRTAWDGDMLTVDASSLDRTEVPEELMREMRSSAIFLGAVLTRCGCVTLSYPGGCELGPRPIDLHLAGLRQLGAEIEEDGSLLRGKVSRLKGCRIDLRLPSVGATENLMLAACGAEGTTVIANAAREPEIVDLQRFLCACGAELSGAGTSTVTVRGGRPLHGAEYSVMPDRIVAVTWLCAAAAAGGEVFLRRARESDLSAVAETLQAAGCELRSNAAGMWCRREERLKAVPLVSTAPYPGFPTDAQAVLMAALLRSRGATVFEENIFENRYRHVDELTRMGADIRVSGRTAVVSGVPALHGARVYCTDLRGGAALCCTALMAEGETEIFETGHIDRGYQDIVADLTALGADITRQETEK